MVNAEAFGGPYGNISKEVAGAVKGVASAFSRGLPTDSQTAVILVEGDKVERWRGHSAQLSMIGGLSARGLHGNQARDCKERC